MKAPRLEKKEIESIKECFLESFPKGSLLYLFGSRADPSKKGGDIDLYIETPLEESDLVTSAKLKFLTLLVFKIGEQKVDVVVKFKNDLPIHAIAKEEGIRLV